MTAVTLESTKVNRPITLMPRTLVNPGSVGSRATRSPRGYAIYDTETRQWEARRVEYHVSEVQKRCASGFA